MIRSIADLTLDGTLTVLYDGIAAAVLSGAVLGIAATWLSVAARGGSRS